MKKGINVQSSMLSMDDLSQMNRSLRGLSTLKLHDEGNYIMVAPKQILSAPKGSVALNENGNIKNYPGLPELIIAEDFANIKPTLEKEFLNYKFPDYETKDVFEYDLRLDVYANLMNFARKLRDEEWFNELSEEAQTKIKESQFYTKDGDKLVLVPEDSLLDSKLQSGRIANHMKKYSTDVVFFAKPVISVKVSEDEPFPQSLAVRKVVKTDEEAKLYGIEKGMAFETPLSEAARLYSSAFYNLYEKPLFDAYPELPRKDVRDMSAFLELDKKRLMQQAKYNVLLPLNRIPVNNRLSVELEAGESIPSYFAKMFISPNTFKKMYGHPADSDANFEPSFSVISATIPKAEGKARHHIGAQYRDMKFNPIAITRRDLPESDKNPFIHDVDEDYAKKIKETALDFIFTEEFLAKDSDRLGKDMTLAEINEIIRQVLQPMYMKTKEDDQFQGINGLIKSFLINDLKFDENIVEGLEENLEGAQFSGAGAMNSKLEDKVEEPTVNTPSGGVPPLPGQ